METSGGPSRVNKGFLLSMILVVGIGVLNFGYSIGVFNSMQTSFLIVFGYANEEKRVRDFWTTAVTTITSIGFAVGALGAGPFTKYGKKNCIHINNVLFIIGCSLSLVSNIAALLTGRLIAGVAGGAFSVFVPSFINEITPVELKG
jgi:major inositol transporter-like SP family MFS transporter